jgi:hypothetical protein
MNDFLKNNEVVTISTSNSNVINVVNGSNFKFSSENENLLIQLLLEFQEGNFWVIELVIDNWQSGKTSLVQVKLVNRVKLF